MSALVPFDFAYSGQTIRTAVIDDEPWFAAHDVCNVLGYLNARDAVSRHVPPQLKRVSRFPTPLSSSGFADLTVINEAGLYRLIMRSNATGAAPFQAWVTEEVLPTIRKTGGYGQQPVALPSRRELAQMVIEAEDRAELAEKRVAELEPKAAAVDLYMDASDVFLVREVAKTLGVQEKVLRQHMRNQQYVMSHPARKNEPYAEYVSRGYFEVKSRAIDTESGPIARNTTFVTTSGVEFLRRSLERAGLIERSSRLAVINGGAA